MKRWLWILVMIPLMWMFIHMAVSAKYATSRPVPSAADRTCAAMVFWSTSATPAILGLLAGAVAFRRKLAPRWPLLEIGLVLLNYLAVGAMLLGDVAGSAGERMILWPALLLGGVVVMSFLNVGASARERMWGKTSVSLLVGCAGLFHVAWLCSVILYLDL